MCLKGVITQGTESMPTALTQMSLEKVQDAAIWKVIMFFVNKRNSVCCQVNQKNVITIKIWFRSQRNKGCGLD